jgi:hypothetical protein
MGTPSFLTTPHFHLGVTSSQTSLGTSTPGIVSSQTEFSIEIRSTGAIAFALAFTKGLTWVLLINRMVGTCWDSADISGIKRYTSMESIGIVLDDGPVALPTAFGLV